MAGVADGTGVAPAGLVAGAGVAFFTGLAEVGPVGLTADGG